MLQDFRGSFIRIMEDPLTDFRVDLAGLIDYGNSKPHINLLTLLAEENSDYGEQVVQAIRNRIFQVSLQHKLPYIYVIDSIMKNVTRVNYIQLFGRSSLVEVLVHIFQLLPNQRDELQIKSALFKLRKTWDGILDQRILNDVDYAIHEIENKWPAPVIPAKPALVSPVLNPTVPQKMHPMLPVRPMPAVSVPAIKVPGPYVSTAAPAIKAQSPTIPAIRRPTPESMASIVHRASQLIVTTPAASKRPDSPEIKVPTPTSAETPNAVVPKLGEEPVQVGQKMKIDPIPPALLPNPSLSMLPGSLLLGNSMTAAVRKALPRIPKKQGVIVRAPGLTNNTRPVRGNLEVPRMMRGRGRGRIRELIPQLLPDGSKTEGVAGVPKRPLVQDSLLRKDNNMIGKKVQKVADDGYNGREQRTFALAPPAAGIVRQPKENQPYRGRNLRSERMAETLHHPYVRPRLQNEWKDPRWRGPLIRHDHLPPRFRPMEDYHRLDFPQHRHMAPMPAPYIPPVTDQAIYDLQLQDVKGKLERGEINSMEHQQLLVKLKKDFNFRILQAAVNRTRPETSESTVIIDGKVYESRWLDIDSKPVLISNGSIFDVGFKGPPVLVHIDHISFSLPMNENKKIFFGTGYHDIKYGGPRFELVIDGVPHRIDFGGAEVPMLVDGQQHRIRLDGPPPVVSIGSKRLNEDVFGRMENEDRSKKSDENDLLERIIASSAFAKLCASANQSLLVADPAAIENVVAGSSNQAPAPSTASSDAPIPQDTNQSKKPSRKDRAHRSFPNHFPSSQNSLSPRAFVRECVRPPSESGVELAGEDTGTLERAEDHIIFVSHLMKLNLHLRDMVCSQCARRFEREDELMEHIAKHEEWVKKDQVHTGGWYIGVDEFIQEKSFETDTPLDGTVVTTVFNDYIKLNRPQQAAEREVIEAASSDKLEPDHVSSENVKINPIVPTGVAYRCSLCNEILEDEDEDYEDRVLKDVVKVTDEVNVTEQFYHRDCYEATKLKPDTQTVQFNKPSRWTSAVIDEAQVDSRPPSYQTAASIPSALIPLATEVPTILTTTEGSGASSATESNAVQDSGFVISFGDEEEEEEEFDVQADFS